MNAIYRLLLLCFFISLTIGTISAQYQFGPTGVVYYPKINSYLVTTSTGYITNSSCASGATFKLIFVVKPDGKKSDYFGEQMDTRGIVIVNDTVFCTEGCELKVIADSKYTTFADNPYTNQMNKVQLNGICYDGNRNLYISSDKEIFRLNLDTKQYKIFNFGDSLNNPSGILWDNIRQKLIIVSRIANASIQALNPEDSTLVTVKQTKIPLMYGIAQDGKGNFYISSWGDGKVGGGKIYKIDKDFKGAPLEVASNLSGPGFIYYNTLNDTIAVPNKLNKTLTFVTAGPPVPVVINLGADNKPVSSTPTFRWRKTNADGYQLQVAQLTQIAQKDDDPEMLGDDFTNPVIDQQSIKDTFYLSPITLDQGKKYVWRVRSQIGTDYSSWSKILSFTPGEVNDVLTLDILDVVTVFPNPANEKISIRCNYIFGIDISIEIFNIYGQVVISLKTINLRMEVPEISVSNLPEGIYFVNTSVNGKVYRNKINIIR